MKKAILTIGLFTLVLATTSFASPKISTSSIADNAVITSIDGNGGQDSGRTRKLDYIGNSSNSAMKQLSDIDGNGGQDSGGGKKID
ncbi:hypothetical protein C8C85_1976 [Flavobacterium sp. 103]|uniref:hypothetical protein n=1 Tax=unclassified Flavobacterium TaxID=196869 RepID=UPI000D5E99D8|nr:MULTISPECIES: hypothetical protein [unclassified Flavobacterium]PVX46151.1 hypothetical protein C8C85_1976 [Flavobacterium sp. 103]QKJ61714.1 hypothetical protein HQN62_00775 [Flavobacterium sp. M31R6]